jgi:hypothetical protein
MNSFVLLVFPIRAAPLFVTIKLKQNQSKKKQKKKKKKREKSTPK